MSSHKRSKVHQQENFPNSGCITLNKAAPGFVPFALTNVQTLQSALSQQTTAVNLVYAQNLGYHFDFANGFWLEPLVGGQVFYSFYSPGAQVLGLQDGQDVRLQGGARIGTTHVGLGGYLWTTSFTGLLYSDVLIHGFVTNADGFSAGFLQADQGQLRVQTILNCKVDLANGFSAFGEAQGRYGTNYYGVAGRIGARYQW